MPIGTNIANGLLLFAKHGGEDVSAEHDEISGGPRNNETLSVDDYKQLDTWGWHYCENTECWMCFV